jgi:hypothetical protein
LFSLVRMELFRLKASTLRSKATAEDGKGKENRNNSIQALADL